AVVVSLLAGPGVLHGMAAPQPRTFEIYKVDEGHFNPIPGGVIFILALGNDARPGETISRADAIHLIGVNPSLGRASILDIPRDTYTDIPGHGTDKINAAHAYGGPRLMAQAVSELVGVDIPYVITTGFVGLTALAKLRSENGSPAGILKSLAVLLRHVTLDGLGVADLYRLGRLGMSIDPANITNVTMPGVGGSAGSASVVFPTAAAPGVFADMRDDGLIAG